MRLTSFLSGLPSPRLPDRHVWIRETARAGMSERERISYVEKILMERRLAENRRDRYLQMIEFFRKIEEHPEAVNDVGDKMISGWYGELVGILDQVIHTHQREDRIIYTMRWVKYDRLLRLVASVTETNGFNETVKNLIVREFEKTKSKLLKTHGRIPDNFAYWEPGSRQWNRHVQHSLSMGIPEINNLVWSNQLPDMLINELHQLEQAHIMKQQEEKQYVDMQDDSDAEIVVKFPDGSAWFDLNRNQCEIEGDAMGHCGNTHVDSDTETVLSYRVPHRTRGEMIWKPHMTFILDTVTGLLGEMKGRANKKPDSKYHPYIIELLRQPFVSGIKGGGYAPEENFSLDDLPQDVQDSLVEEKPGLASLNEQYEKQGWSESLEQRITARLDEEGFEYASIDQEQMVFETFSVREFIQIHGGFQAGTALDIISGNDHVEVEFKPDEDDRIDFLIDMKHKRPSMYQKLKEHAMVAVAEYSEGVEDEENQIDVEDIDRPSTLYSILSQIEDSILDEVDHALNTGRTAGIEEYISDSLWEWVDNPFSWGYNSVPVSISAARNLDGVLEVVMDTGHFLLSIEKILERGYTEWKDFADPEEMGAIDTSNAEMDLDSAFGYMATVLR